jgi:pilus assembly protein Flp/PilA
MHLINLAHIKATGLICDLRNDIKGASMIEYSILIGIVTAGVVGTVVLMGGKVTTWWTALDAAT